MAGFERDARRAVRRRRRRGRCSTSAAARACSPRGGRRRHRRAVVGIDLEDPKLDGQWAARARGRTSSSRADDGRDAGVRRRRVRARGRHRGARARRPIPRRRSPRWRAWPPAGCWSRSPTSRCGGCSTSPAAPTCASSGNTPGHLNHWTRARFRRAAGRPRRGGRSPLAVSVDDAARAGRLRHRLGAGRTRPPDADRRSARRLRRAHPVDRDRLDRDLHLRLSGDRQPRARRRATTAGSRCAGRSCS